MQTMTNADGIRTKSNMSPLPFGCGDIIHALLVRHKKKIFYAELLFFLLRQADMITYIKHCLYGKNLHKALPVQYTLNCKRNANILKLE